MKSKGKFIRKQILWVYLRTILVGILPSFGLGIAGCGNVDRIEQTNQLRMHGKADQAKILLEQLIKEDSTNALAFYELARTQYQMALGNPRQLIDGINQAQHSIDQAMKYDEDNVIYSFFAGQVYLMQAYISLMRGQPEAREKVTKTTVLYEKVLKIKSDYHEAMLYLVELNGMIPEDKGGNKTKARHFADQLKKEDEVYGAQAMAMLLPEDSDKVAYWKKLWRRIRIMLWLWSGWEKHTCMRAKQRMD